MGWPAIVQLIVTYGIPFAEKLWQLSTSTAAPSQSDWDSLKALADQTPTSQLQDALNRAGIPLDSPQAVALLALVK